MPFDAAFADLPACYRCRVSPCACPDGQWLIHGDAREMLPLIEADALVTDPPFGIGFDRATWADRPADYPELITWLVSEARRGIRGWCFVFQAMPNCGRFHEWFPEGWRIFAACKNFAQIRPTGVWHSWDPVVFWNSGPNSGPNSGHINRDYHVGNVAGVFGQKSGHPSPRPIDTMRHLVQLAAPVDAVVVDPFAGSGTTLRACKDTQRRCIAVELEEGYCVIAARRLEQSVFTWGEAAAFR